MILISFFCDSGNTGAVFIAFWGINGLTALVLALSCSVLLQKSGLLMI